MNKEEKQNMWDERAREELERTRAMLMGYEKTPYVSNAINELSRAMKGQPPFLPEANELLRIQGAAGNWDFDEYMCGIYNGMEMIIALAENRDPQYKPMKTAEEYAASKKEWRPPVDGGINK